MRVLKNTECLYFCGPLKGLLISMERSRTLNTRLLDLRDHFIKTVPGRIDAINETLAQCATNDPTAMHRLERQFHTLAGTAGTYGLLEIAAAAGEAEATCADAQEAWLDGESFYYLQYLVDQLRRAADAVEEHGIEAA